MLGAPERRTMAVTQQPVVYLVLRNHWEAVYDLYACVNEPGEGTPVAAFRDRDRAEAFREGLEHPERLKVDPLHYSREARRGPPGSAARGVLTGRTSLVTVSDGHGHDEEYEGGEYWHLRKHSLTLEEARALWEALGGGQFYEVVAVPREGDATAGAAVYVVRRLAWMWDGTQSSLHRNRDFHGRLDFGRPERAFADRHEAEAVRTQLERRARAGQNPFTYAGESRDPVAGRTSLDGELLRDWLQDCGARRLPKRGASEATWRRWWERTAPDLSPLQRAKVWEAFDRIRLYDVVEVELDD